MFPGNFDRRDPRVQVNKAVYDYTQGKLFDKLKLHDTCGINNLHGMPGVISGVAAVVMAAIATEDVYGPR